MAVAVVLFGIAMGIMIATNQTAGHVVKHDALLQDADLTMRQVRAVLEAIVWPEDLASSPSAGMSVAFAKDSLAVFSSHQPTTTGQFCLYMLGYRTLVGSDKSAAPGFLRKTPGQADPVRFHALGGTYEAAIEFRYATEVGEDLQPVWKESLAANERPRLIWVQLEVRDPVNLVVHGVPEPTSVRLQTAIAL